MKRTLARRMLIARIKDRIIADGQAKTSKYINMLKPSSKLKRWQKCFLIAVKELEIEGRV